MVIWIIILIGIAVGLLSLATILEKKQLRFVTKMVSSSLFLLLAVISYIEFGGDTLYFIGIIIALLLSWVGDFLLGFTHLAPQRRTLFYGGVICFTLAQLFFIASLLLQGTFFYPLLLLPLINILVTQIVLRRPTMKTISNPVPVYVYVGAVSIMTSCSISYAIDVGIQHPGSIVGIAGILFFISDFLLLFKYFGKQPTKTISLVNSWTYYAAQVLFALSIIWI